MYQSNFLFKLLVRLKKGSLPHKACCKCRPARDLQEYCFSEEPRTSQYSAQTTNQFYDNLADRSEQPVLLGAIISTETGIIFKILVKFYHQTAKLGGQVMYKSLLVIATGRALFSIRLG